MKAVIYEKYGAPDVLQLSEVPKPTPKPDEVLVRIHAAALNYGDVSARNFANIRFSEFNMPAPLLMLAKLSFGINKPKVRVLGSEFSGEIGEIGSAVTKFRVSDEVFGYSGMKMGAHAEYLCMKESGMIALKPKNMSHEEAAGIPYGGSMALQLLSGSNVQRGQKVLVNGASGGIGSFALQLFRHYGAEVTAVCSAGRMDYVKALGADFAMDYKTREYMVSGKKYDLVFDVLGKLKWSEARSILAENGTCLLASFKTVKLFQMLTSKAFGRQKLICAFAGVKQSDMDALRRLAEEGKIKAIVDRTFPLEEAAKAHEYYENKHNKGHVVLKIL